MIITFYHLLRTSANMFSLTWCIIISLEAISFMLLSLAITAIIWLSVYNHRQICGIVWVRRKTVKIFYFLERIFVSCFENVYVLAIRGSLTSVITDPFSTKPSHLLLPTFSQYFVSFFCRKVGKLWNKKRYLSQSTSPSIKCIIVCNQD